MTATPPQAEQQGSWRWPPLALEVAEHLGFPVAPPGTVWAVISSRCGPGCCPAPLQWYSAADTATVEALVGGPHHATDGFHVTQSGPYRMLRGRVSDVGLLFPDDYPDNPTARNVVAALANRVAQPLRGHVALAEYNIDPDIGEVGWPVAMSADTATTIRDLVALLREGS